MHSRVPQTIATTDTNDECVDVTDTNEVEIFDFLDVTEPAPPFPHMTIEGEAHELRGNGRGINLSALLGDLVPRKPPPTPEELHLDNVRRVGRALARLDAGIWQRARDSRGEPFACLADYCLHLGVDVSVAERIDRLFPFPSPTTLARSTSEILAAQSGEST